MKESDNNVKLIVLDRLIALQQNPAHEKIIQVSVYIRDRFTGGCGVCAIFYDKAEEY